MSLTLELIDCDDGTKWFAAIVRNDKQLWSSPKYASKRQAKEHGEEVLREFSTTDESRA